MTPTQDQPPVPTVRRAAPDDARELAELLHEFNAEYDTPTPGAAVLAPRLERLLADDRTVAWLAGSPGVGCSLVTLRPNVWHDGQVALLDELYVVPDRRNAGIGSALVGELLAWAAGNGIDLIEINVDEPDIDAQRFYERHGFAATEPGSDERAFSYWRELA